MRVIKGFILASVAGLVVFWLRVGADALYLHLHRNETSFPPSFAIHFALQHWIWFAVPFLVAVLAVALVGKLRKSNSPQAPAA